MVRRIFKRLIVLFPRVFEAIRDAESELYYEELAARLAKKSKRS
jgi:hypothetical protein